MATQKALASERQRGQELSTQGQAQREQLKALEAQLKTLEDQLQTCVHERDEAQAQTRDGPHLCNWAAAKLQADSYDDMGRRINASGAWARALGCFQACGFGSEAC